MGDKVKEWLEDNGCPEYCEYCIYKSECSSGIVCYGGMPIEPICFGLEYEEFLDIEAIECDIESGVI